METLKMVDIAEVPSKTHNTLDANIPEKIDPDPKVPLADRLKVDFDKLLGIRSRLVSETRVDEGDLIHDVVFLERNNQVPAVYQRTIHRIQSGTNFFHELEEADILFEVLLGIENESIGKTKLNWGAGNLGAGVEGLYDVKNKKIYVKDNLPAQSQVLIDFATKGLFPFAVEAFAHELAHDKQFSINFFQRLYYRHYFGTAALSDKRNILEVQAGRFGHLPSGAFSKAKLVETIAENYEGTSKDQLIYSVDAIDKLMALGLTVQEVARLVAEPGAWDTKKLHYPRIEESLQYMRQQLGLTEDDLESLVMADRLEREIESLRVKQITQDEIHKAVITHPA